MGIKRVSAKEAVTLQKIGYALVDVRTPEEYQKGHPVAAINIPWVLASGFDLQDNPDFLPIVEKLFPDKSQRLLMVGKIGKHSLAAGEALVAAGYEDVIDLRPGFLGLVDDRGRYTEEGWNGLGLPIETVTDGGSYREIRVRVGIAREAAPTSAPARAESSSPVQRVSAKEAVPLQKIGYVMIDVRTPDEYAKGHAADAINVPWMLVKGFDMTDNPEFLRVVEGLYPDKAHKLLLMGKIGKRSLAAAEALYAAGYQQVVEVRPGFMGIVDDRGRFTEEGWQGLGLPSENVTEGGSYRELLARLQT